MHCDMSSVHRSWAGLKDHAQFWVIMGSLAGSGEHSSL